MRRVCLLALLAILFFTSCTSSANWSEDPYDVYPEEKYLCALGYGDDINSAELDAKKALIELFALKAESKNERSLFEAYKDGSLSHSDIFASSLSTTSKVEELYGVQILEREVDKKKLSATALAVLDKKEAAKHYKQIVDSEGKVLLEMKNEIIASIGSFKGIKKANQYLEDIVPYNRHVATYNYLSSGNLTLISQSEAEKLLRDAKAALVFNVKVDGDYSRIIESDITKTLTSLGFRVSSLDTTTDVNVNVRWNDSDRGTLKEADYSAIISIVDKGSGKTLLAFTTKEREIHNSYSAAYSRAAKMIANTFDQKLKAELQ
ncbi:MAG: LPP20 family lipoprotein [Sphaerochaetaceae bacterium]|nr:LPP20 family lipoprotein [Sphaerochaetaceae bacterium]